MSSIKGPGALVISATLGVFILLSACTSRTEEEVAMPPPSPSVPSPEAVRRVASLRIAFGHQSVGGEIVQGLQALASETNISISIKEDRGPIGSPGVHHFKVGENERPLSKIEDFDRIMRDGVASTADVALMKLCYIDFDGSSDPEQLAQRYIASLEALRESFPATTFVPVTAPLTTIQTGPKAWVKRMLGRSPAGEDGNVMRARFNAALREHYRGDERLFDLASFESRGQQVSFEKGGQNIEALDPSLTYDGGHLNAEGQRHIASALITHINQVTSSATSDGK